MSKPTHTTQLKILSTLILVIAASVALAATSAHAAQDFGYAKQEAACYVFALGAGLPDAEIHADRVRAQNLSYADTAFTVGYETGALDVYAALNAAKVGSYEAARKQAAVLLYEARNCSTAETF